MIPEITGLIASSKSAYEIAKGIGSLKAEVERNQAIAEILQILIAVQQQALAVQSKANELEVEKHALAKKLMESEEWAKTESQYELKQIAPSVFVYAYKKGENLPKPNHFLCPKCYQDKKAYILQNLGQGLAGPVFICNSCKSEFASHLPPVSELRVFRY